jgi:serine/threonine protein phosphatase 1
MSIDLNDLTQNTDISSLQQDARVRDGIRIYAVGDIHGRADLLQKMLQMISADSAGYDGECKVIFLGDYVDRGPDSKEVLNILSGIEQGKYKFAFNVECLLGNHEEIILKFFKDDSVAPGWFHYGGLQTLHSYGINITTATQDFEDIFILRKQLKELMPEQHLAFLNELNHIRQVDNYFFVHAGIHPEKNLAEQTTHHYLWMREPFLSYPQKLPVTVVHGHSIHIKPEVRINRIGIDTGAYVTGHLTAVVLQGSDRRFLST